MAEEKTHEEIVLELQTNFETVLRNAVTQYSSFQTKAGSISRSVESNINTMFGQVSSNLSGMLNQVQQSVVSSVNMTRGAMRSTQQESVKLSKSFEDNIKRMMALRKEFADVGNYGDMPDYQTQAYAELTDKINAEAEKAANEMNVQLGKLAKNASSSILKSTEDTLNAVKHLVDGTKTSLVSLEVELNNTKSVGGAEKASSGIEEMQQQLKSAQTSLKNQAKQVIAAEKEMQDARTALSRQTNVEMFEIQEKYYQETVENVRKTQKAYLETERSVASLQKTIDSGKVRISKEAEGVKEQIKLKIDTTDIDSQIKAVMDNFRNSVSLASQGMSKGFKDSVDKGEILRKTIMGSRQELENMLAEARRLQATGLVDATKEIEEIQSVLGKLDSFKTEFKEIQKIAKFFDLGKWEDQINSARERLSKLHEEINNTLVKPPSVDPSTGQYSNVDDLRDAKANLNVIEKAEKEFQQEREKIIKSISNMEKEAEKIRLQMTKETNKEILNSFEKIHSELVNKTDRMKSLLSAAITPDTSKLRQDISSTAEKMRNDIKESLSGLRNEPKKAFEEIKANFESLQDKFNKLSNTRFVGKGAVREFKMNMEKVTQAVDEYNNEINVLKANLEKLQKLHRMGLAPDAGNQLDALKKQIQEMKANVTELNNIKKKAQNEAEAVARQASKGSFRHGMEMIRNFRWQVAGLIYLASKAANAIKRTFIQTLKEVQQFRIDAMSIAGSMVYAMVGNTEDSFRIAYDYSKDLLRKLEMEAARTILTLEDMMQMTKTFTQAGMVPKSDEDVKNIATIGTAIKTLTEGMANAGVQMRQELYAVILGRQRATDQLAMMFKFVGTNIQDVIDKAKKEGVSIINALSDALAPFEEVNKKLGEEYQTQINKLNIIWDRVKRIGTDTALDAFAETIKNINNSLMDAEGNLTSMGLGLAKAIQFAMETMESIVYMFGSAFSSLVDMSSETDVWRVMLDATNGVLIVISTTIDGILSTLRAAAKIIVGIIYFSQGKLNKSWDLLKGSVGELNKFISRTGDRVNYAADASARMGKNLKQAKQETLQLGSAILSLPFSDFAALEKLDTQISNAKKSAMEGPIKFQFEYDEGIKGIKEIKEGLLANYALITKEYAKYIAGGGKFNDEEEKRWRAKLEGQLEGLAKIAEYEESLHQKRLKQLADYEEKQKEHFASMKQVFDNLFDTLDAGEANRLQNVLKEYNKKENEIVKMIKQDSDEFDELLSRYKDEFSAMGIATKEELVSAIWAAFREGKRNAIQRTVEETRKEFEAFKNSLKSHDVLNPFQEINNELDKMGDQITRNKDFTSAQRVEAWALLEAYKAQRVELANIALLKQRDDVEAETMAAKATLFDNSDNPYEKQEAQLIRLQASYKKSMSAIRASISEINEKWKENGEWLAEAPDSVKELVPLYEKQLEYLSTAFARNRKKSIADFIESQRKQILSIKTDFMQLMETLDAAPVSKLEAVEKEYRKHELTIKEFIEKNNKNFPKVLAKYKTEFAKIGITTVEDLREAIWTAFNEGREKSIKNTTEEIRKDFEAAMESLSSHKVLNPLERINNEMDKMVANMIKSKEVDWSEEQIAAYRARAEGARKERIELELLGISYTALQERIKTQLAYANAMAEQTISPAKKQQAELMKLQAEYESASAGIRQSIDSIYASWKQDDGSWKNETPLEIKDQVDALQQQLTILEKQLKFHKNQVQEPFWNDLRNMTQGWFDDFADVLNEAAFDMDSFSDNFKNFMTGLAKEASRAFIKRNITDKLLSFGADIFEKKTTPAASAESAAATAAGAAGSLVPATEGEKTITETLKEGFEQAKNGFFSLIDLMKDLFGVIKGAFSGGVNSISDLGGSIGGLLQSGFSVLASAFGGGGSSAAAGGEGILGATPAGNTWSRNKDGGLLTEPIIGRGLRSGKPYSFVEDGKPERVLSNPDTKAYSKNSGSNMLSISIPVSVGGGIDAGFIKKLKRELERTVETTTLQVIKAHS